MSLDDRILAAHAAQDRTRLAALYAEAAEAAPGIDARAFFLTQAYVCALDAGERSAARLRTQLVAMEREA